MEIQIINTPGHTIDSVCFLINDFIFCGDILGRGSIGTVEGKTSKEKERLRKEQVEIINSNLMILSEDTYVFPGHGIFTTIGTEKKDNHYLKKENFPQRYSN